MIQGIHLSRRQAFLSLAAIVLMPAQSRAAWPLMTVHKDPNCGCCSGWVEHLQARGFKTKVIETAAIDGVKTRLGVPSDLASCHTGEIAGYVIEGHVPAKAIERLLTERPRAKGLAVPGMPAGSPGMGGAPEAYDVVLFGPSGQSVFGKFRGDAQI